MTPDPDGRTRTRITGSDLPQREDRKELLRLQQENARLKSILNAHDISWDEAQPSEDGPDPTRVAAQPTPHLPFSPEEKIAVFRRLFRGRADVYPVRWESAKGRTGYSPACSNEWKGGVCRKPQVKCADCDQRQLLPVDDQVIYDHLSGRHTVGVYPLLIDDTCCFLAADFDGREWREDVRAFLSSCRALEVPATVEISRSGNGGHVWIFFSERVSAQDARRLGAALVSHTCSRTRQLSLTSYDRFFPNQDTMPKGGFGNLIALPLQRGPRDLGRTVFVDDDLQPYADQWKHLAATRAMSRLNLDSAILRARGGTNPLDVSFIDGQETHAPWEVRTRPSSEIPGPLPESLVLVLANMIFISKNELPQPLANRLIRLAAFQNPEFYKAQAMRFPVWNKPRVIGCAENFPRHIGLPRGCLDALLTLLEANHISADVREEQAAGSRVRVKFTGKLRRDQQASVRAMMKEDIGVLCAPTAFGKTVTAAAMIARRKVSTLILVHRTDLLRQWQERLATFLGLPEGTPGQIGGGRNKPSGKIDIAVMQSLSKRDELGEFLNGYGQIIIDECHHVSAFSFESILKQARARYVMGLTATPVRRDGHQPIIFMQCGPIRHTAKRPQRAPVNLRVVLREIPPPTVPDEETNIHAVFRALTVDEERNRSIVSDVAAAYEEQRKILVLTERTGHLVILRDALGDDLQNCFVLHGRMSKKQRAAVLASLTELEGSAPRVLLATGRLIGEGFDHPPLDTLVLAMPISWKGTLQQYAGRLHRDHEGKEDVRIYDYVERDHPQLARMWTKRKAGYKAMGYQIQYIGAVGGVF